MKTILAILCCTITLTACGQRVAQAPGPNSDIRTIKGFQLMGGDVATAAARACDNEGKKLEVITTTTQESVMSDTQYPVIVFKCVKP
jgi:hypothetical protein